VRHASSCLARRVGRAFHEQTIAHYAEAARVLDERMAARSVDGDFTACDVPLLNAFFADYHAEHSQAARTTSSATCTTCSSGSPRAHDLTAPLRGVRGDQAGRRNRHRS
jgi:hypothetical protein